MSESKTVIGNHMTREVMRITSKGIEVVDNMEVNDITKSVLAALESNIQYLVKKAVEKEREACAKVCDELAAKDKLSNYYAVAARAIRERNY